LMEMNYVNREKGSPTSLNFKINGSAN